MAGTDASSASSSLKTAQALRDPLERAGELAKLIVTKDEEVLHLDGRIE